MLITEKRKRNHKLRGKPLPVVSQFTHLPEISGVTVGKESIPATKAIRTGDTEMGRHAEPLGLLKIRSLHGRYMGMVGKKIKRKKRLKSYNPSQPRDYHGRFGSGGGGFAKSKPVKVIRASHVLGMAIAHLQAKRYNKSTLGRFHAALPSLALSHSPSRTLRRISRIRTKAGYNPAQARDAHGRWLSAGGHGLTAMMKRMRENSLAQQAAGKRVAASIANHYYRQALYRPSTYKLMPQSIVPEYKYTPPKLLTGKAYDPSEPRDARGRWTAGAGMGTGVLYRLTNNHRYQTGAAARRTANEIYTRHPGIRHTTIEAHNKVTASDGEVVNGLHYGGRIQISAEGSDPHLLTAHELGHVAASRSELEGTKFAAWRKAVDNTAETKQWVQWQKQGYINHRNQKVFVSPGLFKYYLSRDEQWARSFAQHHASHSKNWATRSELRVAQKSPIPYYWSNRSFGSIDKAIDNAMRRQNHG